MANRIQLVVGVGASAGGLAALKPLISTLPAGAGMVVLVTQHIDPAHESLLPDILGPESGLDVVTATDGLPLEPDHVYVTPPDRALTVEDGTLRLSEAEDGPAPQHNIDPLFRTLAATFGPRSAGILLSGSGSDGTAGLRAIKSAGGLALVQDPQTAEHAGMPTSAMEANAADLVLAVPEMAKVLQRFISHTIPIETSDESEPDDAETLLEQVTTVLITHEDFDLQHFKPSTALRRIARRMSLTSAEDGEAYLDTLQSSPEERRQLTRDLLINVTDFFRDTGAFSYLQQKVIPEILRGTAEGEAIRIWVAGCATGEEAYTVAMLVLDARDRWRKSNPIQVFATDVDEQAVEVARRGAYPESIADHVPAALLEKFFTHDEVRHRFVIRSQVRDLISFAVQNAATDPPFNNMSLISCRNVLIYLRREIQERALNSFYFALNDNGFLLLGSSETTGSRSALFRPASRKWRIFQKIPGHNDQPSVIGNLRSNPSMPGLGDARRTSSLATPAPKAERLRQRLLEAFLAPAVVVDRNDHIIYNQGNWAPFMAIPTGEPRTALIDLLLPALRSRTRSAVHRARRDGISTTFRSTLPPSSEAVPARMVEVQVAPLDDDEPGLIGLTFRELENEATQAAAEQDSNAQGANAELERELAETQEQLQSTIEQLETSNEELKTSNEEALSTNEELQSVNEELEASSEELRSLNEELSTVNAQLKEKIEQLQAANDDVENFFASTNVPTLFLDLDLEIQKFTPAAAQLLRLNPQDIGRPVSYLGSELVAADLVDECQRVLQRFESIRTEVHTRHGETFLRQLTPYRTGDRRIEGVVVVFQDVTEIRSLIERAESRELQQEVVAHLGLQALTGGQPADLIDQAVRRVAHVLKADFCKVLRYQPQEGTLLLEAGVGWRSGLVGTATVGDHQDSQAGYALICSDPVIVEDLEEERRFSNSELLESHGVVSGMSCVIKSSDTPYGVISVHTRSHRTFREEDANFLQSVANMLATALRSQEAQEQLYQSEEQFRTLANTIPQLAWMSNPDGTILWRSRRWFEFTGLSPELVPPKMMTPIIHPDHADRVSSGYAAHLAEGKEWEDTFPLRGADGEYRWFLSRAIPLRDGTNRIVRWFGTHTDITERRSQEIALLAGEEKLRLAMATSHIGAFEFFLHHEETDWDPLLCELWGVGPDEVPTQQIFWEGVHPDDAQLVRQKLEAASNPAGDLTFHGTYRVINRQTGAVSWVQATGRTLPQDHPERMVGMIIDVTAQRELETSLHRAVEELKETDRKKNDFLSVLGHELRNPLGALSNSIQLLKIEGTSSDVKDKALGVMSRSVGRMSKLLDDLLDLNRVSHNKVHLDHVMVNLHDLLQNVVNATEGTCRSKNQTLTCHLDESLAVTGDPTRLEQVFSNLLINAHKFTPNGGDIELSATRNDSVITVSVRDNGIGIEPQILKAVFDPFFQGRTDSGDSGLGLGLALAKELVERHGGTIFAESAGKERGATFTVTLPAATGTAPSRSIDDLPAIRPGIEVVLIEDNGDIAWTMTRLLRSLGCQVIPAETASEGIRLATVHDPAVVIIDIGLPDLSGYQVAEALRERQRQSSLLVALSGYSHDEARQRSRKAGFDHHLAKPVRLEDLGRILGDVPSPADN